MSKSKPDPVSDGPQRRPASPAEAPPGPTGPTQKPGEIGGRKGPEPTRYGDWEVDGRCTDF